MTQHQDSEREQRDPTVSRPDGEERHHLRERGHDGESRIAADGGHDPSRHDEVDVPAGELEGNERKPAQDPGRCP